MTLAPASRVVFVVDDEPLISVTLELILTRAGFKTVAFTNPFEAIKAAQESAPDMLISDVIMPGMTGLELGIHFRKVHPECRVLLFSGQASTSELLEKARTEGHNFDILAKPVHPNDLLAEIHREPWFMPLVHLQEFIYSKDKKS